MNTAYLITFLQIIYSSWEWIFLLFCALSFTDISYGGMYSAILFLINSIVRSICGPLFAPLINNIDETKRIELSILIKIAFFIFIFLIPIVKVHPLSIILWAIFINMLLVIDSYACLHLVYRFSDNNHLSFIRNSTINNLGKRGAVAIASIIVFQINDWIILTKICLVLAAIGIVSAVISLNYIKRFSNIINKINNNLYVINKYLPPKILVPSIYIFCVNIFFGSGTLIFIRAIPEYGLIYNKISLLTFFYTSFIIINIIIFLLDKRIESHLNWRNLSKSYLIMSIICIILYSARFNIDASISLSIIWGGIYCFSLIAFSNLITKTFQGQYQSQLIAKTDSFGRAGFILSQITTGYFLDLSIEPLKLLQLYGLISFIVFFVGIFIYRKHKTGGNIS